MHLFKCSCGESIKVLPKQAGQSVQCPECQQNSQLPKLRELRDLPLLEEGPQLIPENRWSNGRGILFSLMALGLMISLVTAGVSTVRWWQIEKPLSKDQMIEAGREAIGNRDAPLLLTFWEEYGAPGMGNRQTPPYVVTKTQRDGLMKWMLCGYALAIVFLIAAVAVMRAQKADSKRA